MTARYWGMDCDEDNRRTLSMHINGGGTLIGIVDKEMGGIVAYVMHEEVEGRFVRALNPGVPLCWRCDDTLVDGVCRTCL